MAKYIYNLSNDPVQGVLIQESTSAHRSLMVCHGILSPDLLFKGLEGPRIQETQGIRVQMFLEPLLCASHCYMHWRNSCERDRPKISSRRAYISVEGDR